MHLGGSEEGELTMQSQPSWQEARREAVAVALRRRAGQIENPAWPIVAGVAAVGVLGVAELAVCLLGGKGYLEKTFLHQISLPGLPSVTLYRYDEVPDCNWRRRYVVEFLPTGEATGVERQKFFFTEASGRRFMDNHVAVRKWIADESPT